MNAVITLLAIMISMMALIVFAVIMKGDIKSELMILKWTRILLIISAVFLLVNQIFEFIIEHLL